MLFQCRQTEDLRGRVPLWEMMKEKHKPLSCKVRPQRPQNCHGPAADRTSRVDGDIGEWVANPDFSCRATTRAWGPESQVRGVCERGNTRRVR